MENTEKPKKKLYQRVWFWVLIVLFAPQMLCVSVLGVTGIGAKCQSDRMKKQIDPYGYNAEATGTKVIGFDEEKQTFSGQYIPSDYDANNPNDVGYILLWKSTLVKETEEYSKFGFGGSDARNISGMVEYLDIRLVDYKTGNVIASREFKAEPPHSLESDADHFPTQNVSEDTVEEWVSSMILLNSAP